MADADVLGPMLKEFRRLKSHAEAALAQARDEDLDVAIDPESNSLAILVRHMAGNMQSRWTDFLTTDGEKPDRDRDREFEPGVRLTRSELLQEWERGWNCLFAALTPLHTEDLARTVSIRGEPHTVAEAIARQLTHYGEHVGQVVFLAKHLAGERWRTLSIPRGRSRAALGTDKTPGRS
jgi:alkanesulfonate monooxygenase SsuD/methylene tetrahydromethanopterin reductase-like flavin-dependent oxidoreductase (luciferase family)